jgi:cyclophilin family peptidyl-prolyl cis-trans isomerase
MNRISRSLLAFLSVAAAGGLPVACGGQDLPDGLYATMATSKGTIVLRLEYQMAPMTVANFVGLAEGRLAVHSGKHYYDGLKFHRVVDNFMIQGGDPTGTGTGGPGYSFPDEFSPELKHDGPGVLSMANSGSNTNGSQFFITHVATPWLDGKHSVFGRVVSGQEVVNAIKQGDTIRSVRIQRVGKDAQAFVVTQESFDRLVEAARITAADAIKAARERDLASIAERWPDATVTPSGLRYVILEKGTGPSPTQGTKVTCHYKGELLDGTVFDSSFARGTPGQFTIGKVIPGWNEALLTMRKGERRIVIIPPELGYGESGYPGVIPGNAFLVFELKLISF